MSQSVTDLSVPNCIQALEQVKGRMGKYGVLLMVDPVQASMLQAEYRKAHDQLSQAVKAEKELYPNCSKLADICKKYSIK